MKILITGGSGFLAQALTKKLLNLGLLQPAGKAPERITNITLFDQVDCAGEICREDLVKTVKGDIGDTELLKSIIDDDTKVVIHLASVVSAAAEQDFDLGVRVNIEGTRNVFEACRALSHAPTVVFSSSIAVYGGESAIDDRTPVTPMNSYGIQKAVCEHLLNDYSRKGFLDGRCIRLPTVIVRPGRPNAAASAFVSSIIREPLNGERVVCPVNRQSVMPVLSIRRVVDAIVHLSQLETGKLGSNRVILSNGLAPTVSEIVEALRKIAGDDAVERIEFSENEQIQSMVDSWPRSLRSDRAEKLGLQIDSSVEEIIENYIAEELQ